MNILCKTWDSQAVHSHGVVTDRIITLFKPDLIVSLTLQNLTPYAILKLGNSEKLFCLC